MAMVDYGSVVKKNGIIIQKDMVMDMKEAVGFKIKSIKQSYKETIFDDDEDYKPHTPKHFDYKQKIDGYHFSYIGDEDLLLCVYKCRVTFISHGRIIKNISGLGEDWRLHYEPMVLNFNLKGVDFHIKKLNENANRYKMRFWYKGDLYECLYGYGVDVDKDIWYNVSPKERRFIDNWFSSKN